MAKREKPMDDEQLCSLVSVMVKDAESYRNERSVDRIKATEYFDGKMEDVPADEGRSQVVSRDVRSAVKKVLPSILRTMLGNDQIVEYAPIAQGDEGSAEQATDYVNFVVLPECEGRQAIEDAINDALRLRNGILKWWQEETVDVKVSVHTGLDEMAFIQLLNEEGVEPLEHTQREETIETPQGAQSIPVHDVKIRRRIATSRPMIKAIPLENWLIHPDAIRLDDSPILGENYRLRRSDLVKMGYDREVVDALPSAGNGTSEQDAENDARRRDTFRQDDLNSPALQEVDYYDLLVRIDYDDDGIAELRRMVFAGGLKAEHMLENTEWDEINYADIVSERRPHQWEGNSIPDDVMEIQKIKTVLLRQTLDNLYWQNNLQPIIQEGQILNPSSVMNPKFGEPIRVAEGIDVRGAIGYNTVPMVADKSFSMLAYMDEEVTDRTGISDASSGMAPDALQNMTAKATALVEQSGIGQTEMMVRCIANSLKPVFRGLLSLIIQHQDKPRTVRLRNEWVTFDPRSWNASMDAVVNIGLGAGTRERDMISMQQVVAIQKDILTSMGAVGRKYVTPDNLYNSISRLIEAAGLKSVNLYINKPDAQEIEQLLAQQAQQPSPEEIKAKAAMDLEQVRGQQKIQVEQFKGEQKQQEFAAKMQVEANKEREQRDADLHVNLAELERETEARRQQLIVDAHRETERNQTEIDKAIIHQQTEREWMQTQRDIQAVRAVTDIHKSESQAAGKAFSRAPDGNTQGRTGR